MDRRKVVALALTACLLVGCGSSVRRPTPTFSPRTYTSAPVRTATETYWEDRLWRELWDYAHLDDWAPVEHR